MTVGQPSRCNNDIPLVPRSRLVRLLHLFELKVLVTGFQEIYSPALLYRQPQEFEFEGCFESFYEFYQTGKQRGRSFSRSFIVWLLPMWALQSLGFTADQILFISYNWTLKGTIKAVEQPTVLMRSVLRQAALFSFLSFLRGYVKMQADVPLVDNTNRVETIVYGMYFRKLATIDLQAMKRIDVGAIKSGMTSDLGRLTRAVTTSHQLVSASVSLVLTTALVTADLGRVGFIGCCIFALVALLQQGFVSYLFRLLSAKMVLAEARHKTIGNIIAGMKSVKFNVWEESMMALLDRTRRTEQGITRKAVMIRSAIDAIFYLLPLFTNLLFLVEMRRRGTPLETRVIFGNLGLLSSMTSPLRNLMFALTNFSEAFAALRRIAQFIDQPDQPEGTGVEADDAQLASGEVVVEGLTAAFERDRPTGSNVELLSPVLREVSFAVCPGQFLGVIGKIGSGKTALLKALMRMVVVVEGSARKHGRIAYVSQESFLISGNLRDNVTFGLPFDEQKYAEVLELCELDEDVKALPAGDETEVGERGVTLSGGQRQRISIARALYADSDIYLVDDCLSALDSHVGQAVFRNVFKRHLRGKTIIMVTHALQYLKKMDRVLLLEQGRVVSHGAYSTVLADPVFAAFVAEILEHRPHTVQELEEAHRHSDLTNQPKRQVQERRPQAASQPAREEARSQGFVGWRVYYQLVRRGGVRYFLANLLLMATAVSVKLVSDRLLAAYVSSRDRSPPYSDFLGRYVALLCALVVGLLLRGQLYSDYISRVSYALFNGLIGRLMRKRMSFFDTTPVGQLVNLTSKDTDVLDVYLPIFLLFGLTQFFQLSETIVQSAMTNALLLPILALLLSIFLFILYAYLHGAIELTRLQQVATSPVLSNIIELHSGLALFRAFARTDFHRRKYARNVNRLLCISLHDKYLGFYVLFLLEVLSSLIVCAIYLVVGLGMARGWGFAVKDIGIVVAAVSSTMKMPTLLSGLFYVWGEAARNMSSAERVMHHIGDDECEAAAEEPPAPPGWPGQGGIEAFNLSARYRPELPLVLKGLSFAVRPGEKLGVVGRTGSGKSSLLLALTRIIETEPEGFISIDGVHINAVGVKVLRRAIKVIPQEAFCFKGTLRENVDPESAYSDKQVIDALKKSQLWDSLGPADCTFRGVVEVGPKRLKLQLEEGGKNFSEGQKQLLCIARAILARPRLLLMDEATSNIDLKTDWKIQKIIRKEFQQSTVVTIAHRLNTIIQYDRLLVIDDGRLVETGPPAELLVRDSLFRTIVRQNGAGFEEKMLRLALNKEPEIEDELVEEFGEEYP